MHLAGSINQQQYLHILVIFKLQADDLNLNASLWLISNNDVVLRHTLPVFTELGRCPIVSWDFVGAVSIFGPDALPVVHQ